MTADKLLDRMIDKLANYPWHKFDAHELKKALQEIRKEGINDDDEGRYYPLPDIIIQQNPQTE